MIRVIYLQALMIQWLWRAAKSANADRSFCRVGTVDDISSASTERARGAWVGTEPEILGETFRARMNDRRDLFASSRDAMVVAGGKISKCRSQLFAAWEQLTVYLRQALNALAGVGRRVIERPRRLRKVLRSKENNLRKLLAGSLDAIVVMDVGRRLVAANPKAFRFVRSLGNQLEEVSPLMHSFPVVKFYASTEPVPLSKDAWRSTVNARLGASTEACEWQNMFSSANFAP